MADEHTPAGRGSRAAGTVCAIVLAAGRSTRFGRDKRLEPIDGSPMFLRTAMTLKQLVPDTLIVLADTDSLHSRLAQDRGIATTLCAQSRLGMGHSLAHGVAQRRDCAGWLIVPADMPFIRADTVRRVLAGGARHGLAAPVYRGRRGHPVWFAQSHGDALCALDGDRGARAILEKALLEPDAFCLVQVDDPGCVRDVDLPADLDAPKPKDPS